MNAYISHDDADEALAKARSEIEFLHGKSSDSMAPLLERMTKGKQLGMNDLDGHIRLYADLRNAYTIAANLGREADFSFETIRKLVRSRLDHLSTAYFTKDQKHMTKHQRHLHFEDLLSFIGQWVMVLTSKGNPQEGSTSRVAALGAEMGVVGETPSLSQSPPRRPPSHPLSCHLPGPLTPKSPPLNPSPCARSVQGSTWCGSARSWLPSQWGTVPEN